MVRSPERWDRIERIAEDHLRILRFFRFHARYGRGAPDAAALAAIRSNQVLVIPDIARDPRWGRGQEAVIER